MKKVASLLAALFLFPALASTADTPEQFFAGALNALQEGVPQVAIEKIKKYLASDPPVGDRAPALIKLSEAQLEAGDAAAALLTLDESGVDAKLLRARALAALQRWEKALELFVQLKDTEPTAALGAAQAAQELGRTGQAIALLENQSSAAARLRLAELYLDSRRLKQAAEVLSKLNPVTPMEHKWRDFLRGRLRLLRDDYDGVAQVFANLLQEPAGLSEHLLAAVTLAFAEARSALDSGAADELLYDFIANYPENKHLPQIFRRLDQMQRKQDAADVSKVRRWVDQPPQQRATLARMHLARIELWRNQIDRAWQLVGQVKPESLSPPLRSELLLLQGQILMRRSDLDEAMQALLAAEVAADAETKAAVSLAVGTISYERGEFESAAQQFSNAAALSSDERERALFNAALSWLRKRNVEQFSKAFGVLRSEFPGSDFLSELLLVKGLFEARAVAPEAKKTLRAFVKQFPNHPRADEAQLAIAEIALSNGDVESASRYLRVSAQAAASDATRERAEFLKIFAEDARGDSQKVIELARGFLGAHPDSELIPQVRMKLGQVYFQNEDFANAQTQFELLANESDDPELTEKALFLAGQSATRSMTPAGADRALELFEEVARLGGLLKLQARQQQALIKNRSGQENEAVIIYDSILSASPEPELKFAALAGKGDNLFALGSSDPAHYEEAAKIFEQLGSEPEVTSHWRNQALYKKGKALEKLEKLDEAVTAYYDVLQAQETRPGEPEYFWYYKAGFDAARILETREQWAPAIAIYRKMTSIEGPRAAEAKERLTRLQLEHFIWED